ncbi:hypothetical protein [Flavihumibacter petaseus]|uniref:Uncharacterized protein n=1 Tax=Flavihumibacter petaseus NBRC 106054 TaxID=1220578 RepID=A0A0E9N1R5_9BACT|nr:hypothetical protein [Flavihumibacter petaseus]GAO43794.1 hypothetical protein FPE01S_02_09000 [Flavihumibacter petaseus NBRC 106054]
MGMKFTPQFSSYDITEFIRRQVSVVENATLDQLQQIGEQFVRDARSTSTYKDRTRNLRGSIGYIILKDGAVVFGNFVEPNRKSTGKRTTKKAKKESVENFVGTELGRKLAIEIGKEHPVGYVLVVVAGMSYAGYVEAKGYDVLTGSSLSAEANLVKAINKIQARLKKL